MLIAIAIAFALLAFVVSTAYTAGATLIGKPPTVYGPNVPRWAVLYMGPLLILALVAAAGLYAARMTGPARTAVNAAIYIVAGIVGAWAGTGAAVFGMSLVKK